jgi:hypothetical protein
MNREKEYEELLDLAFYRLTCSDGAWTQEMQNRLCYLTGKQMAYREMDKSYGVREMELPLMIAGEIKAGGFLA